MKASVHCMMAFAFVCIVTPSHADVLEPLRKVAATSGELYVYSRCAGLFQATLEYLGRTRLGDKVYSDYETAAQALVAVSAMKAKQAGMEGGEAHIIVETMKDADAISAVYIHRFGALAAQGRAVSDDELVKGDLDVCALVSAAAVAQAGYASTGGGN